MFWVLPVFYLQGAVTQSNFFEAILRGYRRRSRRFFLQTGFFVMGVPCGDPSGDIFSPVLKKHISISLSRHQNIERRQSFPYLKTFA